MQDPMPKSSRRFTKVFVAVNLVLIWALMFSAVFFQQSEFVIPSGLALIGTMFGIYTGIGHLDFRKAVEISFDQLVKGTERR
jgi:uncharacterized membrane protein YccC